MGGGDGGGWIKGGPGGRSDQEGEWNQPGQFRVDPNPNQHYMGCSDSHHKIAGTDQSGPIGLIGT